MKILFVLLLTIFSSITLAQDFALNQPVNDYAKVLSENEIIDLNNQLQKEFKETGNQISILIIKQLPNMTIEEFSIKMVEKYPLGHKDKDNGVLFTLALNDRKTRIEVGQGLEGILTDLKTKHIQVNSRNFFKDKKYKEGIQNIITEILTELHKNQNDYQLKVSEDLVNNPIPKTTDVKMHKNAEKVAKIFGFFLLCCVGSIAIYSLIRAIRNYNLDINDMKNKINYLDEFGKIMNQNQELINNACDSIMKHDKIMETNGTFHNYIKKTEKIIEDKKTTEKELIEQITELKEYLIQEQNNNYKNTPHVLLKQHIPNVTTRDVNLAKFLTDNKK